MIFEGFSTENNRLVRTVSTEAGSFNKDIFNTHSSRLASMGGRYTAEQCIPVYFAAVVGVPNGADDQACFHNVLYNLREDMKKSPKLVFYMENGLKTPSSKEWDAVKEPLEEMGFNLVFWKDASTDDENELLEALKGIINIEGDKTRTDLAREALPAFIEGMHGIDWYEKAVSLIVWMNRCLNSPAYMRECSRPAKERDIPVLMYYGGVKPIEADFLHFMSRLGIDVLYICSDKSVLADLKRNNPEGRMQIFELPSSAAVEPYPDKPVRAKLATVAYNASRELNNILYSGDTVFRDFQFSDMESLTLKTTFDEIDVLWHQPSKYRTGFSVNGDKVTVPTVFAKISGVKNGDLNAYWDSVKYKLSPDTRVIIKSPTTRRVSEETLKTYSRCYSGERLLISELKNSTLNRYAHLSDSLQLLIFNKLQEVVDSGLLKIDSDELVPLVLHVGMNMDREVLKLLQKYDFTKDIPKLVVIDVIEDIFSKIECIQLVLYNLLGIDLIIYTPTGYRDIESYVSEAAFETHIMNEFKYNVHIPKLKIPDSIPEAADKGGFFGRLFKKGRN